MRARFSRRRLLLGALPLAVAITACDVIPPDLFQVATPSPTEQRRVRVSRPGAPELAWVGGQVLLAGDRVGPERGLKYELKSVPLSKPAGQVRVPVTDPEEWPAIFASYIRLLSKIEAPDLLLVDSTSIGALAHAGAVQDLGNLLKDAVWHKPDEYLPGVLRAGMVRGQQVALPRAVSVEVLLRNGLLFDEAGLAAQRTGWDWSELLRAARLLTRRGFGRWGIMVTPRAPSFFSIAWQQGAVLVTPDGARMDLAEPGTLRALEFLAELVQNEQVAPAVDDRTASRFAELWGSRRWPWRAPSRGGQSGGTRRTLRGPSLSRCRNNGGVCWPWRRSWSPSRGRLPTRSTR